MKWSNAGVASHDHDLMVKWHCSILLSPDSSVFCTPEHEENFTDASMNAHICCSSLNKLYILVYTALCTCYNATCLHSPVWDARMYTYDWGEPERARC